MPERRVRNLTGIVAAGWRDTINMRTVAEALGPDPNADVTLILHSPGGDAREGLAIFGLLRRHKGDVRIEIDGEAASAASLIALAGDSLYMAAGAQLMVHEPYLLFFFMVADKRMLLRSANRLESTITSYVDTYESVTPIKSDQWRQMMADETWINAKEAVRMGIAQIHDPGRAKPAPVPEPDADDFEGDFDRAHSAVAAWHQIAAWNKGSETGGLTPPIKRSTPSPEVMPEGTDKPTGGNQPARPDIPDPYSELELSDESGTVVIAVPKADWLKVQDQLQSQKTRIEELEQQIQSRDASEQEQRVQNALTRAVAETRITPAEMDTWRNRLRRDFELTNQILEERPRNEAYRLRQPVNGPGANGGAPAGHLNSSMRDRLRQSGMDEEAMAIYEEALGEGSVGGVN